MNDFMFLYGEMIVNIIGLIISIAIFLWIVKTLRKVVYPWIALAWREYGPLPRSQKPFKPSPSIHEIYAAGWYDRHHRDHSAFKKDDQAFNRDWSEYVSRKYKE